MLVSEEEAKEKWCPFTRIATGSKSAVVTSRTYASTGSRCLASGCMAWQTVSFPGSYDQLGQCKLMKQGDTT
jgi:hypothetical protein